MQSLCFAAATSGGEREGESEMKGAAAVERRGYNNRSLPKHLGKNVLYCLRRSTWHSRAPQQDCASLPQKIALTPKTPQQNPTLLPERISSAAPEHLSKTVLRCPQRSSRHLPKTMARLHTLFPKKIISAPVNTSARPHFFALEDDISITQNSSARPKSLAQEDHLGTLAKPFSKATMERMSSLSIQLLHHRTESPENSIFRPERCKEGRRSHSHTTEELIKLDLMEQKTLLRFLILFLGFSCVLSSRLLPDQPGNEDPSVQEFVEQGLIEERNNGEGIESEATTLRAKMDVESIDDYSPTGPNPRHNPRPPHSRANPRPPHSKAIMDVESIDDYSPTGPNPRHNPRPPHPRARMDVDSIDDYSPPGPNNRHKHPPPHPDLTLRPPPPGRD
ncbi:hypothetical protein NE237_018965 [Protea cynaroides]|uniref:Uncharacterized protein n=1 Tax=Protea cynaroides TaxID=273540 RepID=A0A9Q0KB37_9MAGN|nr:hypothetical protein NE237_018965 [Protea cynaroides]